MPRSAAGEPLLWLFPGIALGAYLRWGASLWPAVFGAALALAWPAEGWAAVPLALGQALLPWLLARTLTALGFSARLERPGDLAGLAAGCAVAALLDPALAGLWKAASGTRTWAGVLPALPRAALGEWVGMLLAALPLLTLPWPALAQAGRRPLGLLSAVVLGALGLGAALAFAVPVFSGPVAPLLFVPPVLLLALTLRAGVGVAAVTLLALAAAGALLTASGAGPFVAAGATQAPVLLLGYLAALLLVLLLVAALTGDLIRTHARWQLALEGSGLAVADWDLRRGRGFVCGQWRELVGEPTVNPASWLARVHDDERARLREALDGLAQPGTDALRQDVRLAANGRWRWVESRVRVAERDAAGEPVRLVLSMADITDRRASEERIRLASSLFQHLHEGLLITDAELRVLDVNPAYLQIMGGTRQDLVGRVPHLLRKLPAGAAAADGQATLWQGLRAHGSWRGEVHGQRDSGEPCTLQLTISEVRGQDGALRYHVLLISDISEQQRQREQLVRQAHFDELTRLPNRAHLTQMLAEAMEAAERGGHLLAVCCLDLDHFKPVNDRWGREAGDRLLVELSERLRGALRRGAGWADIVARLGGDEFVLLLRAASVDEVRLALERVLRLLAQPCTVDPCAEPVHVTASVGATLFPLDRSDADALLRHADHAMYGAKQAGRNGYLFFDPERSRRTEERVMAIGRVQEALDHGELVLHYQPKVDLRRGVVLGVEALLRWNHPQHGLIPPYQFLPLIEHTGLSAQVGDWVLTQALEQLAQWQRAGLDLTVSVNVSARHLQEPDFAQRVAELLGRHPERLGPRLELEVLETAALADIGRTSQLLEHCRTLGVRFALDDFGTGYSTLTYLKRLPVDVLKIDRSFVLQMLEDPQDLAIVRNVIGLAGTFGCDVVAEGVESAAQARLLIELGCAIGQGQGIAAPMPAEQVVPWVRAYRGPFAITVAAEAPVPAAQPG